MKVKMLKLLSPLLVLALALSLMAAVVLPQTASASPADWYVSTMGSDTEGDGSSGNPWRTIQHAVSNAGVSDGDTIIVHEGTYIENVDVDKELTIRAAMGENVTVQAADSYDHVFQVTADNVTISGFTVTNATGTDRAGIYLGYGVEHCNITNNTAENNHSGIRLDYSHNNTISGNTVSGNEGCGIWLSWYDSGNTISGNTASDSWAGICLYRASNNTLSGNKASDNENYGIYLYYSSNNTISGNNASGNGNFGIRLEYSSNNTISSNTANDNNFGIYLLESSNNTISGNNTASGNGYYGIWLHDSSGNTLSANTASENSWGIHLSYSSNNTISGNIANENNYEGIYLDESSENTVSRNLASDNNVGIQLMYSSHNNTILSNAVHDNDDGIRVVDSSGNWFVGNDIRGNYAEDSGVHLNTIWASVADNHIIFNNIVNNTAAGSYGVHNEAAEIVDASLNWWGDASGPAGVGPGTGDAVSDNVTFEPWLGASVVGVIAEDITGAQEDVEISGPAGSDTTLTVTTYDDVIVAVALYSGNPEEPLPDKALGKYIDIYASDPDAIDWPVYVEMSYTEDEVAAAGIDESTLGLYYWDASAHEFRRCSDTGVDTDTHIIWANVSEDEASGLAGTPFAPGGAAAPTISYSPSSFSFTATEDGANPADQTLEIWNSGGGTLNWAVTDNAPWLSLSPLDGDSTGEHNAVTVSVDISGMTAGSYNATIIITGCCPTPTNTPQTVPVTLNIEPAPAGLSIGVIVGIVIGACAAAGVIAYFVIRRRRAAG